MRKVMAVVAAMGLAVACAHAQSWKKAEKEPEKSKGWTDNFERAKAEAAAFKQPIFAFFTGSDWCGWCQKLKAEVLDTREFAKFATDNLILFEADFPNGKELATRVKKQNAELKAQYRVTGFPSVFLLDAEGKELGRTGYREGGGAAYVKSLKEMLAKAGIEAADKPDEVKPLSVYEKMKAEKEAKAKQAGQK